MDNSPSLLVWVLIVSGATTGILIVVVAVVFGWHQRRLTAEAERWGQHLLAAQDEERHRVARDLHDDMVPRIHAARLAVDRHAGPEASEMLGDIATSIRSIARDLHPPALEVLDFTAALDDFITRHQAPDGPVVTFHSEAGVSLPAPLAVSLFRVAQESIMNAIKHAAAEHVEVRVASDQRALTLSVRDDGCGIPAAKLAGGSFGLRSMRERLKAVQGTLEITPGPQGGTLVVARVPLS